MKESIQIRNFGPIKEIEIDEIRPFTVFIGESGSGKSTVIKTLALFRWFFKMYSIRSYLKTSGISKSPFRISFEACIKRIALNGFLNPNTHIVYTFGNCKIEYLKGKLIMPNTARLEEVSWEKNCFISDKRNTIADILSNNGAKNAMGYYLRETLEDYIVASKEVRELDFDYLGVKLKVEKTKNGDRHQIVGIGDEDYKINLKEASSGTQTVTPLSIIIEYFSKKYDLVKFFNSAVFNYLQNADKLSDFRATSDVGSIRNKRVNIHIEEPELSLYPESQRSLINFIVNRCFVDRPKDYDMSVIMATHSPYIVNHLNLLIQANQKQTFEEGANITIEDVEVYEIIDGYLNNLKHEAAFVIDTRPLSEPITAIYDRVEELKNQ